MQKIRVDWWHGYETLLSNRTPVEPELIAPLKTFLKEKVKGNYYNPIPYMEFREIPPLRHYPHERLDAITKVVDFKGKSVLDIGASMGYYSFAASELGAHSVFPIETYSPGCYVMDQVARIYHRGVFPFNQNIKDFDFENMKVEIIFAFSVLPYLGQPDPEPLKEVLRRMAKTCEVAFIEMGDGGSALEWCEGDANFQDLFEECGFEDVKSLGPMFSSHSNTYRTLWECHGTS